MKTNNPKFRKALNMVFLVFFIIVMFSMFAYPTAAQFDCDVGQHQYVFVYRNPATENEDGYDLYRCVLCGEEHKSILFATGCVWGDWVIERRPTCTVDGLRRRTCNWHVPHTQTERIPALGHEFVLTITPPTCTEDGVNTYTCSRCGEVKIEPGEPALGHNYISEITRQPSCTENGERAYTCSYCGEVGNIVSIPANGHNFGEWTVSVPAQVGVEGSEVRICESCEFREVRSILAILPPIVEESIPLFNSLDTAIHSFNILFVLFGVITLFPSLQAIIRVKKFWKQYLLAKALKEEKINDAY